MSTPPVRWVPLPHNSRWRTENWCLCCVLCVAVAGSGTVKVEKEALPSLKKADEALVNTLSTAIVQALPRMQVSAPGLWGQGRRRTRHGEWNV